jgi:hypothetical protein
MDAKVPFHKEACGMNNRNAVEAADQSDLNVDLSQAYIRPESKAVAGR